MADAARHIQSHTLLRYGSQGYAKWADTFRLRKVILKRIAKAKHQKLERIKKKEEHASPPP